MRIPQISLLVVINGPVAKAGSIPNLSDNLREDSIFDLRPEQLSVEQFIDLTKKIEADGV